MSILVIDDATRAAVRKVIEHAQQETNWYRPEPGGKIPGDNPAHVVHLGSYRCVFTHTHHEGQLLRHLTISVGSEGKYPHPMAAFQIADLFGFTGYAGGEKPGDDWQIGLSTEFAETKHFRPAYVILAQTIRDKA